MAPSCNKQVNFTTLCTGIQLVLHWVIACIESGAQDPARD